MSVKIISEIGINYAHGKDRNEFLGNAIKLIQISALAGVNYVKFQKRTPELAVPETKKNEQKIVPWRKKPTTYLQYKKDIEFWEGDYDILYLKAKDMGIDLFASVWDIESAEFMTEYTDIVKIPSAHLNNLDLLRFCKKNFKTKILSTGMSTEVDIDNAVSVLKPDVIMHTNSAYPTPIEETNMKYIEWLKNKHIDCAVGYSNHYYGIIPAIASVYLGATWVEFHITENHTNWGSDQTSSIEPSGVFKLVKGIRDLEKGYKGYGPRKILQSEESKKRDLSKEWKK